MVAIASANSIPAYYSPNAAARAVNLPSDAPVSAFAAPDNPADRQQDGLAAVKTLDKARQDLLARRKQDALDRLERARKEVELLRNLGGDEKSIAFRARQLAQQIGKAAVEYGDAAQTIRRSGDATAPDQQADASAADASTASTDRAPAIQRDAASANDASTAAPKDPSSAPSTQTGTASAPSVLTDADAAKAFSAAAGEVRRLFQELVLKGRIKHTSGHDWIEAERARAKMDQEIQDLGSQITSGQDISSVSSGPDAQASPATSVNILA